MPNENEAGDALGGMMDGAVLFGEDEPAEVVVTPETKMQKQIDDLSTELKQMREEKMMLMMQPPAPAVPQLPAMVKPEPKPLPDPLDDADGYANGLSDRIMARIDTRMAKQEVAATTQATSQGKYNTLWEAFQVKHKTHAADQRQVKYAANLVAESIAKRGLDVERYMFQYQDQFMTDVVAEMDSIFGKKEATPRKEPQRTAGMFGGVDSGGRPNTAEVVDEDNAFADIRAWQAKTGFHP